MTEGQIQEFANATDVDVSLIRDLVNNSEDLRMRKHDLQVLKSLYVDCCIIQQGGKNKVEFVDTLQTMKKMLNVYTASRVKQHAHKPVFNMLIRERRDMFHDYQCILEAFKTSKAKDSQTILDRLLYEYSMIDYNHE